MELPPCCPLLPPHLAEEAIGAGYEGPRPRPPPPPAGAPAPHAAMQVYRLPATPPGQPGGAGCVGGTVTGRRQQAPGQGAPSWTSLPGSLNQVGPELQPPPPTLPPPLQLETRLCQRPIPPGAPPGCPAPDVRAEGSGPAPDAAEQGGACVERLPPQTPGAPPWPTAGLPRAGLLLPQASRGRGSRAARALPEAWQVTGTWQGPRS